MEKLHPKSLNNFFKMAIKMPFRTKMKRVDDGICLKGLSCGAHNVGSTNFYIGLVFAINLTKDNGKLMKNCCETPFIK